MSSKERKKSIHSTVTFTMKAPYVLHFSDQRNPFSSQHCHNEIASHLCGYACGHVFWCAVRKPCGIYSKSSSFGHHSLIVARTEPHPSISPGFPQNF